VSAAEKKEEEREIIPASRGSGDGDGDNAGGEEAADDAAAGAGAPRSAPRKRTRGKSKSSGVGSVEKKSPSAKKKRSAAVVKAASDDGGGDSSSDEEEDEEERRRRKAEVRAAEAEALGLIIEEDGTVRRRDDDDRGAAPAPKKKRGRKPKKDSPAKKKSPAASAKKKKSLPAAASGGRKRGRPSSGSGKKSASAAAVGKKPASKGKTPARSSPQAIKADDAEDDASPPSPENKPSKKRRRKLSSEEKGDGNDDGGEDGEAEHETESEDLKEDEGGGEEDAEEGEGDDEADGEGKGEGEAKGPKTKGKGGKKKKRARKSLKADTLAAPPKAQVYYSSDEDARTIYDSDALEAELNQRNNDDNDAQEVYAPLSDPFHFRELFKDPSPELRDMYEERRPIKRRRDAAVRNLDAAKLKLEEAKRELERAEGEAEELEKKLGDVTERARTRELTEPGKWRDMLERLKKYKEEHGDTNVPQAKEFPKGSEMRALANWVSNQKRHYHGSRRGRGVMATDAPHRLRALEEAGFTWTDYEDRWRERYQELVEYKRKNGGSLKMPVKPEFTRLRSWCTTQRAIYSKTKQGVKVYGFSEERINLLREIGFRLDTRPTWDDRFEEFRQHRLRYGHCRPGMYPGDKYHKNLQRWVDDQRACFRKRREGKPHRGLNEERICTFDSIGFCWTRCSCEAAGGYRGTGKRVYTEDDEREPTEEEKKIMLGMTDGGIAEAGAGGGGGGGADFDGNIFQGGGEDEEDKAGAAAFDERDFGRDESGGGIDKFAEREALENGAGDSGAAAPGEEEERGVGAGVNAVVRVAENADGNGGDDYGGNYNSSSGGGGYGGDGNDGGYDRDEDPYRRDGGNYDRGGVDADMVPAAAAAAEEEELPDMPSRYDPALYLVEDDDAAAAAAAFIPSR